MFESVQARVPIADLGSVADGVDHAEGICLHVTTFRVPGLRGVPLWYPAAADLGY